MGILDWLAPKKQLTPAQFVTQRRTKYPPEPARPEPDRAIGIYGRLAPRIPPWLGGLFEGGVAALGEVGLETPEALTYHVPFPGMSPPVGYAILVHTGLQRLFYAVSAALHGRMNLYGPGGEKDHSAVASIEETTAAVSEVFRGYMKTGKVRARESAALPKQLAALADALATHAECFVVAHELGHVANGFERRGQPDLSPQDEIEADRFALGLVLGSFATDPRATAGMSQRMIYAGAEFAVRVFAGLAHMGYQFSESHPPPGERLLALRAAAKESLGGMRGFMRVSTIALSQDQLLESIERALVGPGKDAFVVGVSSERLLSSLMVLIEECTKGMLTEDFVVDEIGKIFADAPDAIVMRTAMEAAQIYLGDPTAGINVDPSQLAMLKERAAKETALYKRVIARLGPLLAQKLAGGQSWQT